MEAITGRITSRRVLGKHLAFATLQPTAPEPVCGSDGSSGSGGGGDGRVAGATELVKVCFCRGDQWDGLAAAAPEKGWLPFPQRKSMLPPNRIVTAELAPPPAADVDNQSATGAHQLIVARWRFVDGAGELATSARAFDMSEVARQKAQAHAVARATEAGLKRQLLEGGRPLCKRWLLDGHCEASASGGCSEFRHAFESEEERARAKRARSGRLASLAHTQLEWKQYDSVPAAAAGADSSCPPAFLAGGEGSVVVSEAATSDSAHEGGKQQKALRAKEFVKWLLGTYGADFMRLGSGVLDVAGGKGKIAYALHCEHDIPATVIDPGIRKNQLNSRQRRALKKSGKEPFQTLACYFNASFSDEPAQAELLRGASLVVGMHSDEATEDIVDMALLHDKPFAIVPCCVFAHLAPDRRLPALDGEGEGEIVRDINQFVRYLKAKSPRIVEALLPFEGRNKVLYITPVGEPP